VTARPRKPWRVAVTGTDVHTESDHTSESAAYAFVRATLRGDSPASTARVLQWSDGRWWHYETIHAEDLPADGSK
jgi:hypothetical protein